MLRSYLNLFLLLAAVTAATISIGTTSVVAGEKAYFVDILYLNDGKTAEDAKAYFSKTVPIVAKHGLKRVTPPFAVTQKMSGNIEPHLINVWSVSDPKNTFNNIFADKAYLQHVPQRNATFDMARSHMFMMRAAD